MASKFEKLKAQLKSKTPESPIEIALLNFMNTYGLYGIPQYEIGRYWADIAFPQKMLVVECDGKEFHSTEEQLYHDAERDIFMEKLGWSVERFSGKDIYNNGKILVHLLINKYFPEITDKQVYQELLEDLNRDAIRKQPKRIIDTERTDFYREEMWDLYEEEKMLSEEESDSARSPVGIAEVLKIRFGKLANLI